VAGGTGSIGASFGSQRADSGVHRCGSSKIPDIVRQYYTGPTLYNGAFQFTDSGNRGQWSSGTGIFSPRVGVAYRLNDKTSIRAGYGRYINYHWMTGSTDFNNLTYSWVHELHGASPLVQGVPQMSPVEPVPMTYRYPGVPESLGR
jgi:hypothetical protein